MVGNFIKRALLLSRDHLLEIMFLLYWTRCGNICPTFLFLQAVICFCLMDTRSCMFGSIKKNLWKRFFFNEFAKVAESGPGSGQWDSVLFLSQCDFFLLKFEVLNTYILSFNQQIFMGNYCVLVFYYCWEYRIEQKKKAYGAREGNSTSKPTYKRENV